MQGLPLLLRRGRVIEELGLSDYSVKTLEATGALQRITLTGQRYGYFRRDDVLRIKQAIEKGNGHVEQSGN
jgi:hypothetical protein